MSYYINIQNTEASYTLLYNTGNTVTNKPISNMKLNENELHIGSYSFDLIIRYLQLRCYLLYVCMYSDFTSKYKLLFLKTLLHLIYINLLLDYYFANNAN